MRSAGVLVVIGVLVMSSLLVQVVRTAHEEENEEEDGLAELEAARCRVRCLTKLTHGQSVKAVYGIKGLNVLAKCLEDLDCTACLKPCGPQFTTLNVCTQVCEENEPACEQSCGYLEQMYTVRPGSCPRLRDDPAAVCPQICSTDASCRGRLKCCQTACGHTCQQPHNLYAGAPPIPQDLSLRERPNGASLELNWAAVPMNESVLVLYVLQVKWNTGRQPSHSQTTPWRHITMTTRTSAIVRDASLGRWYQFRLAAVNINGSRGFTLPTKAFRLSNEPQPPGPPENFTEGDTKIQDGKISVTVHWRPPKKTELPISRYKIFWSKRLKTVTAQYMSLPERKKALPGDQYYFELEDLRPDTTYFVQVQAISHYGEVRLKSERASMYITTYPMPQATQEVDPTSGVVIQALPTPSPLVNLSVDDPFYLNGLLKANVSWAIPRGYEACVNKALLHWSPEVCIADNTMDGGLSKTMSATTHDLAFEIYELRFDCRYVVKVQPVCGEGQAGPVSHVTLQTPSCGQVTVRGTNMPDCPTDVPSVPEEPQGVEHSFLIVNTNITAKISWKPPRTDAPLMGYRIIWGQTLPSEQDSQKAVLDQNTALTKVVPKSVHVFSIANLQEAVSYLVRLQALSGVGSGQIATIHFRTPMLQPAAPIDPPYGVDLDKNIEAARTQTSTTAAPPRLQKSHPTIHSSAQHPSSNSLFIISLAVLLLLLELCRS